MCLKVTKLKLILLDLKLDLDRSVAELSSVFLENFIGTSLRADEFINRTFTSRILLFLTTATLILVCHRKLL